MLSKFQPKTGYATYPVFIVRYQFGSEIHGSTVGSAYRLHSGSLNPTITPVE